MHARQVLAERGHEVDLLTHEDVGKDQLADHLGLTSRRCRSAWYRTGASRI